MSHPVRLAHVPRFLLLSMVNTIALFFRARNSHPADFSFTAHQKDTMTFHVMKVTDSYLFPCFLPGLFDGAGRSHCILLTPSNSQPLLCCG